MGVLRKIGGGSGEEGGNYNFWLSQCFIVDSGWVPMNSSMTSPFLKSFTDGIDMTPNF